MVGEILVQRKYQRRDITFLVLLSVVNDQENGSDDFYLGKISNVSLGGVCVLIQTLPEDIAPGTKVVLFVSTGDSEEENKSDLPVQIRGEVVWKSS